MITIDSSTEHSVIGLSCLNSSKRQYVIVSKRFNSYTSSVYLDIKRMASNITEKKETHLKCPSCLVLLTDPMAFPCLHLFCRRCVDDIKPTEGVSPVTIECPVCNQRMPKDSVQSMDCVKELLKVSQANGEELLHCKKCKEKTPTWRCLDCKANFCYSCRDTHNEFDFMKHHK